MLVNPSAFFSCERNQQCIAQRNLGSFPAGKKIKSLLNSKEMSSTKRNVNGKEEGNNIMEDQQKGLMREYPNRKITIKMPDHDKQAELLDKLRSDLPPELRYPCSCKVNLKKDASSYPGMKIGATIEMEDDYHYCYGEITKIEKKSVTFACFVFPKEDKQELERG